MKKLFDLDSPVIVFLGKIGDLLLANLLWMACSLPLVTIGASTTALYYVCFQILRDEETHAARTFLREFKSNLKQATAIWLLLLGALAFVALNIFLGVRLALFETGGGMGLLCVLVLAALTVLSMLVYAFALEACFSNCVRNTVKNAFFIGASHVLWSALMVLADFTLMVLGVLYCPFVVPVAPVMVNTAILNRIFGKYKPNT